MRAGQRQVARRVLEGELVVAVVGDVLADALVAAAAEADDRRAPAKSLDTPSSRPSSSYDSISSGRSRTRS